jgi:riboflavin synthase alpha subunit
METPLGQAVERVVHAAGELTLEGTKLPVKDKENKEFQVSLVEFDEEAKVSLARRCDLEGARH